MPDTTTNTMYPLIREYRDAILSPEDSFQELATLRPVLDSRGFPVMASGNFAVVFKMKDENDGKLYAVKCFLKDQSGRDESYRRIAEELEVVSSAYILPLRYLEGELFVDSPQCSREEFPVVVMEWVEGETLDAYVKRNLDDRGALAMLSYRFNRMAAWLLAQPFAHGDLKPDNILVREDGGLVMVDYDGMFVPAMKGEKARETGSPGYRHPLRTDADFSEHIDDFSIALIALSLKALSLRPDLKELAAGDALLLSEADLREPGESTMLKEMQSLASDPEFATLLGVFYVALAKNSLESLSFRLFMTPKPKMEVEAKVVEAEVKVAEAPQAPKPLFSVDTSRSREDFAAGVPDEFGVIYSPDGKRLLNCKSESHLSDYKIKPGTEVICDYAFWGCKSLKSVNIPSSVTSIGYKAFSSCESLASVIIPSSVMNIGRNPFSCCPKLKLALSPGSRFRLINELLIDSEGVLISCLNTSSHILIPSSVTAIGEDAFIWCSSIKSVSIPPSVTEIGKSAFGYCLSLEDVIIPSSVTTIGESAFYSCGSLKSVIIPSSVKAIGEGAFYECASLKSVSIPTSVTTIGNRTFLLCKSLESVIIPSSVTSIGKDAFYKCESLASVIIPSSVINIGGNPFSCCPKLKLTLSPGSRFRLIDRLLIDSEGVLISCLNTSSHISIPSSVTSIGEDAFYGCKSLSSVSIPSSVTTIEDSTFSDCKSLKSVIIPSSVTSIGNSAFYDCESLESVSIPSSVTLIG
ncbi:MAG: leucine-rich repeat protein, partial [Duncaniella sp.]|nr:leucine-rich repeat protein [Duncaniella sp.]